MEPSDFPSQNQLRTKNVYDRSAIRASRTAEAACGDLTAAALAFQSLLALHGIGGGVWPVGGNQPGRKMGEMAEKWRKMEEK